MVVHIYYTNVIYHNLHYDSLMNDELEKIKERKMKQYMSKYIKGDKKMEEMPDKPLQTLQESLRIYFLVEKVVCMLR